MDYEIVHNADYPHVQSFEEWIVYLLECSDSKLYVGICQWLEQRVYKHSTGKGAKWTAVYPPVKVLSTKVVRGLDEALRLEDHFTEVLARRFGRHAVRGGSTCQVDPTLYAVAQAIPRKPPTCMDEAVDKKALSLKTGVPLDKLDPVLARIPGVVVANDHFAEGDGLYLYNVIFRRRI